MAILRLQAVTREIGAEVILTPISAAIAREDWTRPPTDMSGGQQTRAALARLLVSELDVLLLDEPTNHLDVAAIEWLENQLASRKGALLVASHDRAFLDAVVQRVWELSARRLEVFRGNYS